MSGWSLPCSSLPPKPVRLRGFSLVRQSDGRLGAAALDEPAEARSPEPVDCPFHEVSLGLRFIRFLGMASDGHEKSPPP